MFYNYDKSLNTFLNLSQIIDTKRIILFKLHVNVYFNKESKNDNTGLSQCYKFKINYRPLIL